MTDTALSPPVPLQDDTMNARELAADGRCEQWVFLELPAPDESADIELVVQYASAARCAAANCGVGTNLAFVGRG